MNETQAPELLFSLGNADNQVPLFSAAYSLQNCCRLTDSKCEPFQLDFGLEKGAKYRATILGVPSQEIAIVVCLPAHQPSWRGTELVKECRIVIESITACLLDDYTRAETLDALTLYLT